MRYGQIGVVHGLPEQSSAEPVPYDPYGGDGITIHGMNAAFRRGEYSPREQRSGGFPAYECSETPPIIRLVSVFPCPSDDSWPPFSSSNIQYATYPNRLPIICQHRFPWYANPLIREFAPPAARRCRTTVTAPVSEPPRHVQICTIEGGRKQRRPDDGRGGR